MYITETTDMQLHVYKLDWVRVRHHSLGLRPMYRSAVSTVNTE